MYNLRVKFYDYESISETNWNIFLFLRLSVETKNLVVYLVTS